MLREIERNTVLGACGNKIYRFILNGMVRSGAVGCGTELQVEWSPVLFPVVSLEIFFT